MTVSRIFPSGAIRISAVVGGYLVQRTYCGYTIRQAIALFKQET